MSSTRGSKITASTLAATFIRLSRTFRCIAVSLSAHGENLPVATAVAQQVLCLPIYPDLDMAVVDEVIRFIATP